MTNQPITHKSPATELRPSYSILESSNTNGIKCDWSGKAVLHRNNFTDMPMKWSFDCKELKDTGVDRLSGQITVTSIYNDGNSQKFNVDFTSGIESIRNNINISTYTSTVHFEYSLIPHRATVHKEISYDEMFLPSDLNDTILVVEGKKLHVHKGFLSVHSEFFRALCSSNFKEGQMTEIPIRDVSYEDFGLLMSTVYPKTVYPNDKTVEKLLELADRFMIPAVVGHVEHHLLQHSNISHEKITLMADQYEMPELLDKCIREIDSLEKLKTLSSKPEFEKLSDNLKARVLNRLTELI